MVAIYCKIHKKTIGVKIKYLHTFQNLVFALTGKELEIKL